MLLAPPVARLVKPLLILPSVLLASQVLVSLLLLELVLSVELQLTLIVLLVVPPREHSPLPLPN